MLFQRRWMKYEGFDNLIIASIKCCSESVDPEMDPADQG